MGFLIGIFIGILTIVAALYVAIARPTPPWRRQDESQTAYDAPEWAGSDLSGDHADD
ncbi:hypothetical protein [Methylocystis parvus]|uniref:hypothetical protein n=1 Tax=Methylocystis parvus TaxID=134 RepID=UPI00030E45B4|nr:hypothetical protein [Methylocystis parvus]WBK01802.1 hypothetical protein MMG94_08905 [Methylocystis parvus OBBP]